MGRATRFGVLVLVALATGCGAKHPYGPTLRPSAARAANGELVVSIQTGELDPTGQSQTDGPIALARSGRPLQKIVGGHPSEPMWSPDGRQIAYTTSDGLLVANADGTQRRFVIHRAFGDSVDDASWSPDGTQLVFTGGTDLPQLYVVGVNGKGARRLTPSSFDALYVMPRWSPDGKWIAFAGNDDSLHLIHPDGTGLHTLAGTHHDIIGDLLWSPDSRSLLFEASDEGVTSDTWDVITFPNEAVHPIRSPVSGSEMSSNLAWSPDGKQLAWAIGRVLVFRTLATGQVHGVHTHLSGDEAIQWVDWRPTR